jgi:outer membrane protein TolC
MNRIRAWAALGLVLAFVPRPAAPQEAGLTLEQAVEVALARNPDVLAARKAVDAARGRTLQLGARPAPQLALSLEGLPLPGLRKAGDEAEFSLGLEQVFEYPGKRALRAEVGRTGESIAQAELESLRLRLAAAVKKAYWQAAFARLAVAALERSEELADALLQNIQAKYQAGGAAYADLLRTKAEKARLRNQILEARKERETARADLNVLLGRPADEAFALLTEMTYRPLAQSLAGLKDAARTTRPSFKAAALRKERAALAVKLAGLGRRPDFVAGFFLPSRRSNAWGVSFGLSLPFVWTEAAKGGLLEAEAEAELGRLAAEALERRLDAALDRVYAEARAAEEQVRVFESELLADMKDELKISLEYFQVGKAEFSGLLDLYRSYVLAEVERLRALYIYLASLADLEAAGEELDAWRIP